MPNVIVVGGGIIGCACAHELAGRGAHVMVLERDELAAGASGRNHGLLLAPLDPAMVPMAAASTALYEEIQESSPLTFNLDPAPIGFLVVATDEAEAPAARAEAEAAAACGVRIEQLDDSGIHQLEPELGPGLRAGWHVTGEEWGMVPRSARALATDDPDPDVGTLLQPNPDGTMLVGGSRQPVVTVEPEDPTVPRRILRAAIRLVPPLADAAVLS